MEGRRLTLAELLTMPFMLAFYAFIALPLLLLMAGLDALAPHLPAKLGRPLVRALRTEARIEAQVAIIAPHRRVRRLLFGSETVRRWAEYELAHAAEWRLEPARVQQAREDLTDLAEHAGERFIPLPSWEAASWRTRVLGVLQGIEHLLQAEPGTRFEPDRPDHSRVVYHVRFQGLLVALAGNTLQRDTQRHVERALANLKRRAETGG